MSSDSAPSVLVVTMGIDYIAPARMPYELKRAGFRVALLAPRDSLAAHTGFVDQVGYFPEGLRLVEWVRILAQGIRSAAPALILPGDDVTVRTLMQLVLAPPDGLAAGVADELSAVIRRSLGDPAMRRFKRPEGWSPSTAPRYVVQKWIEGAVVTRASAAWHGREIAGFTRGRLATYPNPLGAGSAVEFAGLPAVTATNDALMSLVDLHGLVGTQYIIDAATSIPYLIEINRRMLPATHAGPLVGVDLAAALFPAVDGKSWGGPKDLPPGRGMRLALFPQEWYRDRASRWLATLPCDAPWHDPGLFAAMVRMRAETVVG